jgi:hypothetical protein
MKQKKFNLTFVGLLAALVLSLAGFVFVPPVAAQAAGEPLSDAEIQGILYMREEEKLARDVYSALYETWELPVFQNIARSEQTHMDAIETLIARYGLTDPITGAGVGEFTDAALQDLYDELVARGSVSLTEALAVGALIEDLDIVDLQERLADVTHADVARVYENLIKGSENHLRAFVRTLGQYGETYAPEYLDPAAFDAIVASGSVGGPRSDRGTSAALSGRRGRGR